MNTIENPQSQMSQLIVRAFLVREFIPGSPEGAAVPAPVPRFNVGEIEVNPVGGDPEGIFQQFADLLGKLAVGLTSGSPD